MNATTDRMPGGRGRRPLLLALVFGIFLVLIGVTASALVVVASTHLSRAALEPVVSRDRDLVEAFVNDHVQATDVMGSPLSISRQRELERALATSALGVDDGVVAVSLRDAAGSVVVAKGSDAEAFDGAGSRPLVDAALAGDPKYQLHEGDSPDEGLLELHLPITSDGDVRGVISIRRDATGMLANLDAARRDIMIVTLAAAAVLAVILYLVFRAAQARLTRQQAQLMESTRRDALTGMLNHGAVVAHIAEAVDAARAKAHHITVALIDIDNFRLFNDTHGHEAGDSILLLVADLVTGLEDEVTIAGRYGPDEFIAVWEQRAVADVQRHVTGLAASLKKVGVQFGGSEELPVSVSIGIASFPDDATSVTDLLSEASVALGRAKSSGGDSVALARDDDREKVTAGSFDVLQGLVIAVDTKDRYTKRHSEDVARYAVFLARQLGFEEDMLDTIHLAGLLHDIGKIGIPDALLRKPGKLTAHEYGVFQQHVALGDAIVRDVPHVELVRSGIKHHHERWDGGGYLEGLHGEDIPIVGRVLAVADAFSAMTTTRPYRKALPIEEALKRLGDAAGTQLQEELVSCFINGIETAADAPLPGETPNAIWRPHRMVA